MIGSRSLSTCPSSAVIGHSPEMVDVVRAAVRVANTKASVLIRGEGGTGRAQLARFLHQRSGRADGPFVEISCAALGHHFGDCFERANGGTLFLEEVTDLSGTAQVELLRVLESSVVERYDTETVTRVDVRLIGTTGRDIEHQVASGRFRRDLYHRLPVIELTLPPLRERGDDVRMLAEHFVGHFAMTNDRECTAIAQETLALLLAHPWPGNVRELRNALERATAASAGPLLVPTDLPADVRHVAFTITPIDGDGGALMPLDQLERLHIERVVAMTGGNVRHAAALLGIGSATLQLKLRRHRVH